MYEIRKKINVICMDDVLVGCLREWSLILGRAARDGAEPALAPAVGLSCPTDETPPRSSWKRISGPDGNKTSRASLHPPISAQITLFGGCSLHNSWPFSPAEGLPQGTRVEFVLGEDPTRIGCLTVCAVVECIVNRF